MSLSPAMMQALLGAISRPAGKPNRDEIEASLVQLAEAAAAICRVMPAGTADHFIMQFNMALERQHGPRGDEE